LAPGMRLCMPGFLLHYHCLPACDAFSLFFAWLLAPQPARKRRGNPNRCHLLLPAPTAPSSLLAGCAAPSAAATEKHFDLDTDTDAFFREHANAPFNQVGGQ